MDKESTKYKGIFKYHISGIFIGGMIGAIFGVLLNDRQSVVISAFVGIIVGEIIAIALHAGINANNR